MKMIAILGGTLLVAAAGTIITNSACKWYSKARKTISETTPKKTTRKRASSK